MIIQFIFNIFSPLFASVRVILAETVMLGKATVTGFAGHQRLASALACHLVTALIAQSANQIAGTRTTAVRVFASHVPKSVAATVTAEGINSIFFFTNLFLFSLWPVNIVFANAFPSNKTTFRVLLALTNSIVFGASSVALARPAHVWVANCAVKKYLKKN